MRRLPVLVEPFAAETVGSFYRRLARRNAVPTGELWTTIRHTCPNLPLKTTPEFVPRLVEELAGLPHLYFTGRRCDRLFVRCAHTQWAYTNCPMCAPLPAPVTKCRRCTRGQTVDVRTRGGAVCIRHRRWHYAGADDALPTPTAHIRAERFLTGTLWQRGIGVATGELELATELILFQRGRENHPGTHNEQLKQFYPEAVKLTALLTEPWAERFLSNTNAGRLPVAALVEAAATAISTHSQHELVAVRESFHTRGRESAVSTKRPVRLRYGRSPGLGELGTHILAIAPRVRATFLRHADARQPLTQREYNRSSRRQR